MVETPDSPEEIAEIKEAAEEHADLVVRTREQQEQIDLIRSLSDEDLLRLVDLLKTNMERSAELEATNAELQARLKSDSDPYYGLDVAPTAETKNLQELTYNGTPVFRDRNGNRIDGLGNRVDAYGNQVDNYGNRMDQFGRPVDSYGQPLSYEEFRNSGTRNRDDYYRNRDRNDYRDNGRESFWDRNRDKASDLFKNGKDAYKAKKEKSSNREALLARIKELQDGNAQLRQVIASRNNTVLGTDTRFQPYVNAVFDDAVKARGANSWDPSMKSPNGVVPIVNTGTTITNTGTTITPTGTTITPTGNQPTSTTITPTTITPTTIVGPVGN